MSEMYTLASNSFIRSCTRRRMMFFACSLCGATCLASTLYFLTASSKDSTVLAPTTPYNDQTPLSTTADSALRLHLADLFYCGYSKLGRGLLKQTSGSCGASDLQAS